ncbi:unnamed protein product [Amoebophrya sp. A120]|nr:unnamed protein product [Amoebophrya sp. A120]|eukprot:GSA120T00019869001.1
MSTTRPQAVASSEEALEGMLTRHFKELSGWKAELDKFDISNAPASQQQNNLNYLPNSGSLLSDPNRGSFNSPETGALRTLDGITQQAESMKDSERLRAAERKTPAEARLWQRPKSFSERRPNEIEQVLRQIEDAAAQLGDRIRSEPAVLPRTFLEDLEALIRQNVILKTESEKTSVRMLDLQDEVTRLRHDADRNQETFDSMRVTLAKTTNERNELAEECRHGLAMQERDEYARQIVRAQKQCTEYEKRIQELEDLVKSQDRKIEQGAAERERLKFLGRKQAEKFKEDVARLVSDKKALRAFLEKMQSTNEPDLSFLQSSSALLSGVGLNAQTEDAFMEQSILQTVGNGSLKKGNMLGGGASVQSGRGGSMKKPFY